MVAAVEPQWIESAGAHLIKRSYTEPHWVEERGFVAAFESASLYGLTLAVRRRVNYGSIAPQEAREIFVREALIEGRTRFRAPFLDHNRRLRREVEQFEAKVRRRDILVDEQALCDFYLARLPADVHSTASLERFLRSPHHSHERGRAGQAVQPDADIPAARLTMTIHDLRRRDAAEVTPAEYPDTWPFEGNELPIQYRFEPGAPDDGATVTLPLPLLAAATSASFSAPIPGWRVERITETLRALPKAIRKAFVPVPDTAARAAAETEAQDEFHKALAEWITRTSGSVTKAEDLAALPSPPASAPQRASGRSARRCPCGRSRSQRTEAHSAAQGRRRRSDAQNECDPSPAGTGAPPAAGNRRASRAALHGLSDAAGSRRGRRGRRGAERGGSRRAVAQRRSCASRCWRCQSSTKYARKRFADERDLMLLGQGLNDARPLPESLTQRSFSECFLKGLPTPPRTADELSRCSTCDRASFGETVDHVLAHALEVLRELRAVRQKLVSLARRALNACSRKCAHNWIR